MTSIVSLALAYAFLLLLLLLALVKSELPVSFKALAIALACGFYIWHYAALQAWRGWPAEGQLPQRFEMLSRVVVEPDPARDEAGGIYLWVRDLEQGKVIPRAYRLPYSRDSHQRVEDTLQRQRQGQRFVGRPAPNAGSGGGDAVEFEPVERERAGHKPGSAQ